jgi:hypothetical protein
MVQALVAIGQNADTSEDENHTFKIVLYCAQGADPPPPVPLSAANEGRNIALLPTGIAADIAKPYQLYV